MASTPMCFAGVPRAASGRGEAGLELGPAPTFLFVGHNFYLKGLPDRPPRPRAAREGGAPPRLCVVGAVPSSVRAARRPSRRRPTGPVLRQRRGPPPYLAAADVLVHPTFYDACSLVALEAWAMGVPVITSRWDGAHDLWPADPDGWLVEDPSDVGAVARAMRAALDPARREAAAAWRDRSPLANTLERNFARIEALYIEALRARGERGTLIGRTSSSAASASSTARWTVVTSMARMYRPSPSVR